MSTVTAERVLAALACVVIVVLGAAAYLFATRDVPLVGWAYWSASALCLVAGLYVWRTA